MYAFFCCTLIAFTTLSDSTEPDAVEFLNGMKLKGKVTSIRKDKREFDFQTTIGQRVETQTLSYHRVHAVYLKGKKHVLTEKPVAMNASSGLPCSIAFRKVTGKARFLKKLRTPLCGASGMM